jgi:transcriptional regulator with XRE-family HTH domain
MKNLEDIGQRIELLVAELTGGNRSLFASKIGTSETNIRNYINGRLPKSDTLLKIVTCFDVSANWLLTGKGDMIKNTEESVDNKTLTVLMDEIKISNQEIGSLKKTIDELMEENKQLKEKLKHIGNKKETKEAAQESHTVHT